MKNSMKIRLILLPVLAGLILSANAQKKMKIAGKVTGLPDSSLVVLTDVNNPADTIAQARMKGGSFLLQSVLPEPKLLNLQLSPGKNVISFFDNSSMRLTGDATDIKTIKVKGAAVYQDFRSFQKTFDPLFEKLMNKNQELRTTGNDSLRGEMNLIIDTLFQRVDVFVSRNKKSPVSAFLLTATLQLKDDPLALEKRMNMLKPAAKKNLYGKYLEEMLAVAKVTAIGSIAADFTQADTSGVPVSLSSFRGQYVLLDFWASWCGPCRYENPNVVASYEKFKGKNFTILGVSLDRPGQRNKWLEAIYEDKLTWTHVSDLQYFNNAVAVQYRIESIPQNLLIGPDGKILAKNLRGPGLEQKLCEILGCN